MEGRLKWGSRSYGNEQKEKKKKKKKKKKKNLWKI